MHMIYNFIGYHSINTFSRNFTTNNFTFLPDNKGSYSQYTTSLIADDLYTAKKFDIAIDKAGFPNGPENAAKVNEIVDDLKAERDKLLNKYQKYINEDCAGYRKQADRDHSVGIISTSRYNK